MPPNIFFYYNAQQTCAEKKGFTLWRETVEERGYTIWMSFAKHFFYSQAKHSFLPNKRMRCVIMKDGKTHTHGKSTDKTLRSPNLDQINKLKKKKRKKRNHF